MPPAVMAMSPVWPNPSPRFAVAEVMPLFAFYLQPSVGGRVLSASFWRRLAGLENLVAIKVAPFNRYQTLDVVRAVAEAARQAGLQF